MVKVLFVEDDRFQLQCSERVLSKRDHSVNLAQDGLEALSILDCAKGIQIIFTDCDMLRMNGIELTHTIRTDEKYKRYSNLPIIGVGCFPKDKRTELTEYLGKPHTTEELLLYIFQYCR